MPSLKRLVDGIASALTDHLDLPFALFGHSMGALLSFELARQLRREGRRAPEHLCLSGRGAPQLPTPTPPIHELPDDEFVREVSELNGMPSEVTESAELMELVLPVLRADFAACETFVYRDEAPLACSISAYGGLEDPQTDREALEGWRQQTEGSCVVRMFPGDHFYLQKIPQVFFQALRRDLDGVMNR